MMILVAHAIMRALLCCLLNNLKESTKRRLFLLEFLSSLFEGGKGLCWKIDAKLYFLFQTCKRIFLFYSFDECLFEVFAVCLSNDIR